MSRPNYWHATPLRIRLTFLTAVFFIFASFGFAIDSIDLGSQPILRFAISVVLSALFSTSYAAAGFALRERFWKACLPIFVLHFASMALLGHSFPDPPPPAQLNASQTAHLRNRLVFDGCAIIASICLGYTGFVYVSISEGRRYADSQAEKATLESEMAAAREVQRLMVPEELPIIPGYTLESVYEPAAQVGGDFFQVIPLPSSQTLVVIGDVSGKGLRAAMIVSSIIGTLRTLTAHTEQPAAILAGLNSSLWGRMHGGFATCLIVRLEDQGRLTLANAGHPAPYLNAEEVPSPGSIPLGLLETTAYAQTNLQIHSGDTLLLLTDGIAEAQNAQGDLLGFPRVQSLLRDGATAVDLAQAAQHHGQTDDLTVIRIARTA